MALEAIRGQAEESLLDRASPFILLLVLFGIPAASWVALVLLLQVPRFLYGRSAPLLFAAEIGSLLTVLVLLLMLRACLALPSAAGGFYRNVLDFLAMARWHPSVMVALLGLLVLPGAWILQGEWWLVDTLQRRGWEALTSGDVQDSLDRITVAYQLALTGGVPLLFALHMLSRWKPKNRFLPWLLVPLLFVGTAIAVVILVMLLHTPS